jgi:hypothetical protein
MTFIQLQFRRDTSVNWQTINPVLASGEMGIETDTNLFKIGNGILPWNALSYGGLRGPTGPAGGGTGGTGSLGSTIRTHLVPDVSGVYDLGSADFPFRDGYFSANSIRIGRGKLIADPAGNIQTVNASGVTGSVGGAGTPGATGATGVTGATGATGAINDKPTLSTLTFSTSPSTLPTSTLYTSGGALYYGTQNLLVGGSGVQTSTFSTVIVNSTVLIGSSTSAGNAPLQVTTRRVDATGGQLANFGTSVASKVIFYDDINGSMGTSMYFSTSVNQAAQIGSATNLALMPAGSRIGMNTASPVGSLHVVGNSAESKATPSLYVQSGFVDSSGSLLAAFTTRTGNAGKFTFYDEGLTANQGPTMKFQPTVNNPSTSSRIETVFGSLALSAGTGLVGVNTANPQYTLDVKGSQVSQPILAVTNTTTNSTGGMFADFATNSGTKIRFTDEQASFNGPSIGLYSSSTKPGIILTGSANSLALLPANQCVGINTTLPQYNLDVNGSIRIGNNGGAANADPTSLTFTGGENNLIYIKDPYNYIVPSTNAGSWGMGTTRNGSGNGTNWYGGISPSSFMIASRTIIGAPALTATVNNFIGVNTPTPAYNLDVSGSIHGSSALIDTTLGIGMAPRNSYKLDVSGNAEITNVLTVGNSLGVGPGTFGSSYNFDVKGSANVSGSLNVTSTIVANGDSALIGLPSMLVAGPNASLQMGQIGTKSAILNFCTKDGQVWGMGVLSTATTAMYRGASPSTLIIGGLRTNEHPGLSINNVGVDSMRVGVNTANPQYTLDVNGDMNVSGTLTAGNFAAGTTTFASLALSSNAATAPILRVTNTYTDNVGGVFAEFGSSSGRKIRLRDELTSFTGPTVTFYSSTNKPGIIETASANQSLALLPQNQRVGINTITPEYAVDVNGSIRIGNNGGAANADPTSLTFTGGENNLIYIKDPYNYVGPSSNAGAWGMGTTRNGSGNGTNWYGGICPSSFMIASRSIIGSPALTATVNNFIGVNISKPKANLDVSGTVLINGEGPFGEVGLINSNQNVIRYDARGNSIQWYVGTTTSNAGWTPGSYSPSTFYFTCSRAGAATSLLSIEPTGLVGISCNLPRYSLDIAGSSPLGDTFIGWTFSSAQSAPSCNTWVSNTLLTNNIIGIHSVNSIWTNTAFIAASDERIKKNIVDASSSLAVLSSIKLRSFEYKDPADTRRISHGVIAQEILAVYPEAVTQHTDVIPNILQEVVVVTSSSDGNLLLVLPSDHGLAMNDSVQLSLKPHVDASGCHVLDASGNPVCKGEVFETTVLSVNSPTTFTVAPWAKYEEDPLRPIMVVGKRVNDFLSVDKEALGLLAVGGVQELVAQQQAMQQQFQTLESEHKTLESEHKALQIQHVSTTTSFITLESKFSTLLGMNPGLTI